MPSPKAAIPAAARPPRREQARKAVIHAHARRQGTPDQMLRWLGSYITAIATSPTSYRQITETFQGVADGLAEAGITTETQTAGAR